MFVDDISEAIFLKIRELKIERGADYNPNLTIYMTYGFYYLIMAEIKKETVQPIDSEYSARLFERERFIHGFPVYLVEQHLSQPHKDYQIVELNNN